MPSTAPARFSYLPEENTGFERTAVLQMPDPHFQIIAAADALLQYDHRPFRQLCEPYCIKLLRFGRIFNLMNPLVYFPLDLFKFPYFFFRAASLLF